MSDLSKLDDRQRANLVALVNGYENSAAICRKVRKHSLSFWQNLRGTDRYRCGICGIVTMDPKKKPN